MNWKDKLEIMKNSQWDYPVEVIGNDAWQEIIVNNAWGLFVETVFYKHLQITPTGSAQDKGASCPAECN